MIFRSRIDSVLEQTGAGRSKSGASRSKNAPKIKSPRFTGYKVDTIGYKLYPKRESPRSSGYKMETGGDKSKIYW
jgi:hypothetical protein